MNRVNKIKLYILFIVVGVFWLRNKIEKLHPVEILFPIVTLQVASFILLATKSIYYFSIANMVIVGIALLPFALRRPQVKYHWIRGEE